MTEYRVSQATLDDREFIAEAIMQAEKSNSDKLGLCTVFEIPEPEMRKLIVSMLEEEIEGCEFSIDSFLIVKQGGVTVAAIGGWVEGHAGDMRSRMLKSNLIGFTFPKDSIAKARLKAEAISGIQIERENLALQVEYVYVSESHRGQKLGDMLLNSHFEKAVSRYPELKKAQVQVFANNEAAIRLYQRNGFSISGSYSSLHKDVLHYLPHHEKLLMEKIIEYGKK